MVEFIKFYSDDETQKHYQDRVLEIIKEFKRTFRGFYKPVFHDEMIKELVRCEITCRQMEMIIAGDNLVDDTPHKTLQQTRTHMRSIWDQLQISMKGQRGDKKNISIGNMDNFKEFAKAKMYLEFDIEEEESDEDNQDSV